jgi:hypothetical protein
VSHGFLSYVIYQKLCSVSSRCFRFRFLGTVTWVDHVVADTSVKRGMEYSAQKHRELHTHHSIYMLN